MSFHRVSEHFIQHALRQLIDPLTPHWVAFSKRWGLKPVSLLEGLTLWGGWAGLTWLAFVGSLLFVEVGERSDLSLAEGVMGGALISLAQWWVLRSHLSAAHRWMMASILGWGTLTFFHIGALGWMAPGTSNLFLRSVLGIAYGAYVGLGLGIAQWFAIRRQLHRAWRWIPLNAGLWAVAIAFGWLVGGTLRSASHLFVSEVLGLMVAWGAISTLSGIGIVGLIYQAQPSKPFKAR